MYGMHLLCRNMTYYIDTHINARKCVYNTMTSTNINLQQLYSVCSIAYPVSILYYMLTESCFVSDFSSLTEFS